MIYANEQRANEIAAMLNERPGHPRAAAVLTSDGWTVTSSYAFGVSGPTVNNTVILNGEEMTVLDRFGTPAQ